MKAYFEYTRISLLLALRDRVNIFFNYVFPLAFFLIFAQAYHARQGGAIIQVVTMVLIIGILGNGFFGAGVRSVQEREFNILRRFKVAPITPLLILTASMVTGFLIYMPTVFAVLAIAHFYYGMTVPAEWPSLLVFAALGILAFRAVGLIVASVVNSMQESQILVQILYLPMLFLSGATFPVSELPGWLQIFAQFLPATYLYTGMQGILFRHENLAVNWLPIAGLLVTGGFATFIGVKLFRWEKEEKIPTAGKAWLLAVLAPFLIIGGYQVYSQDNLAKARILYRELHRSRTILIRNARIFSSDRVLTDSGAILIRAGRIAAIYPGAAPPLADLHAEPFEAAGKTAIPGLIDCDVHLHQPGGFYANPAAFQPSRAIPRELEAYLYSGITTVRSSPDPAGSLDRFRRQVRSGELLGAELCPPTGIGPIEHGSGLEIISDVHFRLMKSHGIAYLPALSLIEAAADLRHHATRLLDRSLVEQVGPAALLASTRRLLPTCPEPGGPVEDMAIAQANLRNAWKSGVRLIAGSGSGYPLLVHGPALHHELQLWAEAGIPAAAALAAATSNAARQLNLEESTGLLQQGREATLLLVDGNPAQDIAATERISAIFFRGEHIARSSLFSQD